MTASSQQVLLSDYVVDFLSKIGIKDVFLVSGGGIMYLLDSLGRNAQIQYYCNYHEQACVAAAEGYARLRSQVGVCLVTTGPGGANAVSAIPGAWVDSVPLMIICGQVKRELIADYEKIRQIGPQEGNIVGMAKPVTKYAVSIRDPQLIRYELEYAYHQAVSGRPGPVLIEIPVDVQGTMIEPQTLQCYSPPVTAPWRETLSSDVDRVIEAIRASKRPVMVCGNGIHRAGAQQLMRSLLEVLHVPVVLPLTAKDILEEDHPCYGGIFGTAGQRRANFIVQGSDCLIALGAGLNVQKIGFNVAGFAPRAKKVIVDVDDAQLKYQIVRPDVAVHADLSAFLPLLTERLSKTPYKAPARWLATCGYFSQRYPVLVDDYFSDPHHVNSYVFMDRLADALSAEDILVTGNALDTTSYFQAFRVKKGQRTMNSGWGAMGWCLPMTVGSCIGNGKRRTICATGDGSFQFNSQELLTISRYDLPVKIFVLNNQGYSNIRATQNSFFEGRYVGADFDSGVTNPNFECLAAAYGFKYSSIGTNAELDEGIKRVLETSDRWICELNISPKQGIWPKASAFRRPDGTFESRPLEDMAPFLPREELAENMRRIEEE
jgi:acetolactate synthase-1/2/3 large subunit